MESVNRYMPSPYRLSYFFAFFFSQSIWSDSAVKRQTMSWSMQFILVMHIYLVTGFLSFHTNTQLTKLGFLGCNI